MKTKELLKALWNRERFWIGFVLGALAYQTITVFVLWVLLNSGVIK